jgi:7,8-dihydropterin-6-yl-methyl-4-(beta-D-ribofuranosyl)aminobenzene 5'-phosphate synthase
MAMKAGKQAVGALVTVYDNYAHSPGQRAGWGFSCLVRTGSNTVLFDTGADSPTLLHNMEKLGVQPGEIEAVVLSHIHGDHVGGLAGLLEKNPNLRVYMPESFPRDLKRSVDSSGSEVIDVREPEKICARIQTTGELGEQIREQSLMVETGKGMVVLTGCAHPGIVSILERSKEISGQEVYLVTGGFHLAGMGDPAIRGIISSFRALGVQKAAPCHCSGERARHLFEEEYGDDYISNGAGRVIELG